MGMCLETSRAASGGETAGQQPIEDLEVCERYTRDPLQRI
jgi:hypothetical protein